MFGYIRDHLGYRLELAAASFPASLALTRPLRSRHGGGGGAQLVFGAELRNYGFSAPLNPRPVQARHRSRETALPTL